MKMPLSVMACKPDYTSKVEKCHDLTKNYSEKAPSINDSTMDEGRHESLYTDPKLSNEAFSDFETFTKEGKLASCQLNLNGHMEERKLCSSDSSIQISL